MKVSQQLFVSIALVGITAGSVRGEGVKAVASNPYQEVDWAACERHKANFHTHTHESDGRLSVATTITRYKEMGYTVLAITDHNAYTWPWTQWDQDPAALGMVAIPGSEASRHDHVNSFWCDYGGASGDIAVTLSSIDDKGGLAQLNHPGRYSRNTSWYLDHFRDYESLIALEVYNQGDRYSGDRALWDALLTQSMPDRPIWGTSNDDMHKESHLFRNWQVLLTPAGDLAEADAREAMIEGRFYACYDPTGDQSAHVPLDSLTVRGDTITVHADCDSSAIRWISNGDEAHQGPRLVLSDHDGLGTYVRAEIHGVEQARTLTQPLGLMEAPTSLRGNNGSSDAFARMSRTSGANPVSLYSIRGQKIAAYITDNAADHEQRLSGGVALVYRDGQGPRQAPARLVLIR